MMSSMVYTHILQNMFSVGVQRVEQGGTRSLTASESIMRFIMQAFAQEKKHDGTFVQGAAPPRL